MEREEQERIEALDEEYASAGIEGVDHETPPTVVPDHTLREGTVLSVRLNYGGELNDMSAWYRVRIENPRNGWYDYVEYSSEEGLGGEQMNNFHDYDFSADNFNQQFTSEHYDSSLVPGYYAVIVSNSQGYQLKKVVVYGDDRFSVPTMSFDVP